MSHYTIEEAEVMLETLLERVSAGEEVVITREGQPVVQMLPVAEESSEPPAEAE